MKMERSIKRKATHAAALEERIQKNVSSQAVDLVKWIFDRIAVSPEDKVLEICCGTGKQTAEFVRRVGNNGKVVAIDVSSEALSLISDKIDGNLKSRLQLLNCDMDNLEATFERNNLSSSRFDWVFCAYGLYYSKNPLQLLDTIKDNYLKPSGRIVIVGPFGDNNGRLFEMLEQEQVVIPKYVRFTSQDFMLTDLFPWAVKRFSSCAVSTLCNRITWESKDDVLNYWKNTTFYDEHKASAVERRLREHFEKNDNFINEKWIMMAEMRDER